MTSFLEKEFGLIHEDINFSDIYFVTNADQLFL